MNDLNFKIALIKQKIQKIKREPHKLEPSAKKTTFTSIPQLLLKKLLPLQDSLMYFNEVKRKERLKRDLLKIPFTHISTYNPDRDPYILELGEKCDRGEIPQSECDRVYDYLTAGTITISLEGCGYCYFLVITGATRGQVWFNADVVEGGYILLNLSFLDWYEQWLDKYFCFRQ